MTVHILDYAVFFGLSVLSVLIGLYFGFYRGFRSVNEYMIGNNPALIPVMMSVIVTLTTPKHLIADTAELVMYGSQALFVTIFARIVSCAIVIKCFLPVLLELKSRSLFEYFERRHDKYVRKTAVALSILREMVILPILVYLSSTMLQKLIGVPHVYLSSGLVLICLSYTCLGGLDAVIWADSVQYIIVFVAVIAASAVGMHKIGGFEQVLQRNWDGERMEFFNFGNNVFTDRFTFTNSILGAAIFYITVTVASQAFYQRLYAVQQHSRPKCLVLTSYIGTALSGFGAMLLGMIVYAYFKGCHPLLTNDIVRADHIVLYFVDKISASLPGLLGMFSAGLIAALLSTLSTSFNTIACSVHDEFISPAFSDGLSEKSSFLFIKSTVILIGVFSLLASHLCDAINSLYQGLITGALAGVLTVSYFIYNSLTLISKGHIKYATKLIDTEDCNSTRFNKFVNYTSSGFGGVGTKVFLDPSVSKFSALSYSWYSLISIVVSLIICNIISLCTGGLGDMSKVDPAMIIPQLRWILPKRRLEEDRAIQTDYSIVPLTDIRAPDSSAKNSDT